MNQTDSVKTVVEGKSVVEYPRFAIHLKSSEQCINKVEESESLEAGEIPE